MAKYVLNYFNLRGRGEIVRLVFVAAGQAYEDKRIEFSEWPALKSTTPFGQLPYLEVHESGKTLVLAQSLAIARFLAKRFNLAGQNEYEQAEAEMYGDQLTDLFNEYARASREKDETRKNELLQQLKSESIPNNLKSFESKLSKSTSGYLIGKGLTWVDLYLMNLTEILSANHPDIAEKFPLLRAHHQKVSSLPNIADWLQRRPKTNL